MNSLCFLSYFFKNNLANFLSNFLTNFLSNFLTIFFEEKLWERKINFKLMDKINILILGNDQKEEIISIIENLNLNLDLNIILKDCSKLTHNQSVENFFSLINDIQYFNALILNFSKKEDIICFFKNFNSEEYGITNECFPFFVLPDKILSKLDTKYFINDLNKSKEDDYKFKFGNFLFFKDSKGEEFQHIILDIYNCYKQDSKKLKDEDNLKETINILLVGVKNCGKSYLINKL